MRFAPSPPHPQPLALKERISLHFVELNIFSGFFTPPVLRKEVSDREQKEDNRVLSHMVKKEQLRCIQIHNHLPAAVLFCNYWDDCN